MGPALWLPPQDLSDGQAQGMEWEALSPLRTDPVAVPQAF